MILMVLMAALLAQTSPGTDLVPWGGTILGSAVFLWLWKDERQDRKEAEARERQVTKEYAERLEEWAVRQAASLEKLSRATELLEARSQ